MKVFAFTLTLSILMLSYKITAGGSVEFKFNKINSMISDIVWCGKNKEFIFALTEDSYLYRSTDKGFSFKNINNIIKTTAEEELANPKKDV